jgi:hypothetical protein
VTGILCLIVKEIHKENGANDFADCFAQVEGGINEGTCKVGARMKKRQGLKTNQLDASLKI